MSDIAIKVENLSKRYVISHQRAAGDGLRHVLQEKLTAPLRWLGRKIRGQKSEASPASASSSTSSFLPSPSALRPPTSEEFWALKDVSFEVKQGEVVGIIGRNGAGKSTLLKVLSRITEPTSGRITIEGRVASLLEVGTGFHPELTGRENIFLNGAILGMSRLEIKSKFDEIVAFAEIEKFLDTPVKRYSSGMYVRLAFAVAAHLEPEILIVDEVLAVGDAQFQKKCLGKMQDVARTGERTVLFVSHQMDAIQRLTRQCIWLSSGRVEKGGPTSEVTLDYIHSQSSTAGELQEFRDQRINGSISFDSVWIESSEGRRVESAQQGDEFYVCLTLTPEREINVDIGVVLENQSQQALFATHLTDRQELVCVKSPTTFRIRIQPAVLRSGSYFVSLAVFAPNGSEYYDVVLHYPLFSIAGSSQLDFPADSRWGDLYFQLTWEHSLC
jgi:lipopolysaccharide transport system ATP-binding protein